MRERCTIWFDWCYQSVSGPWGSASMMRPVLIMPWPFPWAPYGGLGPLRWCICVRNESKGDG